MLEHWFGAIDTALAELQRWPARTVQVFHHNDADGITSGAILTRAFERQGFQVRRFCLEKPYPAVLRRVYEQEGGLIVFADFAGRIAPLLSELNRGRNLTLILDHHVAEPSSDPRVHNLDPDLYGLKGDRDISGSVTCYRFALAMDSANHDLAPVAAVGAVADGFFVDGRLVSLNREAALESVGQGRMQIRETGHGEEYVLIGADGGETPVLAFGDTLDLLGGVGYYQDGPNLGVQACLDGISPELEARARELNAIRTRLFDEEIARLRAGALQQAEHIQWFHVGERFFPMGVKMIGAFCDAIKDTDLIDPRKYLAGFQVIPDQIPGFGAIAFNEVKISMRVSPYMEGEIRAGRAPGLNTFLPEATGRLGGFSDACHSLTAATTVAIGREEQLIEEMETILQGESSWRKGQALEKPS